MDFFLTEPMTNPAAEIGSATRRTRLGAKTPIGAPFGKAILSTKYWDSDTKTLAYQLRDYGPGFARWMSRDPIGEKGGGNVYVFTKNAAIDKIDYLGLRPLFPILWIPTDYPHGYNELRPYYNLFPWYDSDLPGEGESCCCNSRIDIVRKDGMSLGITPIKIFRFRSNIDKNDCIRNLEYVYKTCWRYEIPHPPISPDYVGGAIPESWMQNEYNLTVSWGINSSMESSFYIKWQECVGRKWKTNRDIKGSVANRL